MELGEIMKSLEIIITLVFLCSISVIIINFFLVLFAKNDPLQSSPNPRDFVKKPYTNNLLPCPISITDNNIKIDDENDVLLVKEAMKIIADNFHNPYFTIDKLADELHTSIRSLQRKFKTVNNSSPSKELKLMRLECALNRLSQGEKIKLIGRQSGFSSQSYFCKCFKESTGITPSEFVKNNLRAA
jgi:AraC-like DNA-binding protein